MLENTTWLSFSWQELKIHKQWLWDEQRQRKGEKMFCPSAMFSLHFPAPCQWLQNKRICELNPIVLKRSAAKFRPRSCSPSVWKNVLVMCLCVLFSSVALSLIVIWGYIHLMLFEQKCVSGASMHVSRRKKTNTGTHMHIVQPCDFCN